MSSALRTALASLLLEPATFTPASGPLLLPLSDVPSLLLCVPAQMLTHVRHLANQWTASHHALLSMGFSKQEYWIGLPCPPPGDLPHPGIKPSSPVAPALAGRVFRAEPPGKPPVTEDQSKNCSSHMARL